jgi:uncharacterized protein (DUF1697 family)
MRCAALLRGINVGGNNRVPMAELRKVFEDAGHTGVRTYINSGNVVFDAPTEYASSRALKASAQILSGRRPATAPEPSFIEWAAPT